MPINSAPIPDLTLRHAIGQSETPLEPIEAPAVMTKVETPLEAHDRLALELDEARARIADLLRPQGRRQRPATV